MGAPAVLVYKLTKEIIKDGNYPNEDNSPLIGFDPDYEWLIKHTPYPEPSYDSRIFTMVRVLPDMAFYDSFKEHPLYSGVREYKLTFKPTKRADAEIIISIENAEKEANNLIISEATHKDEFVFMLGSINKKGDGQTLNATELQHLNILQLMNVQLAKNKDNAEILKGVLSAGKEPNIDEGWEKSL